MANWDKLNKELDDALDSMTPEDWKILNQKHKQMNHPDPKLHQRVSFIKSGVRIAGYIALVINIPTAVTLLVISEAIGIVEELV
jgi:hypothetical protein